MRTLDDNASMLGGGLADVCARPKASSGMKLHSSAVLELFQHQKAVGSGSQKSTFSFFARNNNDSLKHRIKATEDALDLLKARCNSVSLIHKTPAHHSASEKRQDEESGRRASSQSSKKKSNQKGHTRTIEKPNNGETSSSKIHAQGTIGDDDVRESVATNDGTYRSGGEANNEKVYSPKSTTIAITTIQTQLENLFHAEQERRRQAEKKVISLGDRIGNLDNQVADLEGRCQREEWLRNEAENKTLSLHEKMTNLELKLASAECRCENEVRLRKDCETQMEGLQTVIREMQSEIMVLRASPNKKANPLLVASFGETSEPQNQIERLQSKDEELAKIREKLVTVKAKIMQSKAVNQQEKAENASNETEKESHGSKPTDQMKYREHANQHGRHLLHAKQVTGRLTTITESLGNEDGNDMSEHGKTRTSGAPTDENSESTVDFIFEIPVDMSSRTSADDVNLLNTVTESYSMEPVMIENTPSEISVFMDNVPMHLKLSFKQVGFYCDGSYNNLHRPVLCVDPWSVPPGPIQTELLNHPDSMLGVYFYAENDVARAYKAIKWFKFISFSRGQSRILHRIPREIEARRVSGNLSDIEKSYCKAMKMINEEASKNPDGRMHPFHATYRKTSKTQAVKQVESFAEETGFPKNDDDATSALWPLEKTEPVTADACQHKSWDAVAKEALVDRKVHFFSEEVMVGVDSARWPQPVQSIDRDATSESVEVVVNNDAPVQLNSDCSNPEKARSHIPSQRLFVANCIYRNANQTDRNREVLNECEKINSETRPIEKPRESFASTTEKIYQVMQCIRPHHAVAHEYEHSFATASNWTTWPGVGAGISQIPRGCLPSSHSPEPSTFVRTVERRLVFCNIVSVDGDSGGLIQ